MSVYKSQVQQHAQWVGPTLELTYNTWSRLYLCCRDCSVLYGLKDAINHCLSLVRALLEYFFFTPASEVSALSVNFCIGNTLGLAIVSALRNSRVSAFQGVIYTDTLRSLIFAGTFFCDLAQRTICAY